MIGSHLRFGLNREFFSTELTKSLTGGDVSLCTIQASQTGANIPCPIYLSHSFALSNTSSKAFDYATSYPICSISKSSCTSYGSEMHLAILPLLRLDNLTSTVNSTPNWDSDSVNIMVISRPSSNASGTYSINLNIFDSKTNSSVLTPQTFSLSTSPSNSSMPSYQVIFRVRDAPT